MSQLVKQAIYTSSQTKQGDGYQVVSRSRGISEEDIRELSAWGPSHDSLIETTISGVSLNYFRLPSRQHAISRTVPAGAEYSGRRGYQIYTQYLVITDELFAKFANNAFEVLSAAGHQEILTIEKEPKQFIDDVRLEGEANAVNIDLLTHACGVFGVERISILIRHVLENQSLGLLLNSHSNLAIATALNCLPVLRRRELSFSTGLKYSSRRSYRIFMVADSSMVNRRISRTSSAPILDLNNNKIFQTPKLPWQSWIENLLNDKNFAALEDMVGQIGLNSSELDMTTPV